MIFPKDVKGSRQVAQHILFKLSKIDAAPEEKSRIIRTLITYDAGRLGMSPDRLVVKVAEEAARIPRRQKLLPFIWEVRQQMLGPKKMVRGKARS